MAQSVLDSDAEWMTGRRSRAAALLGRQALEQALDEVWARREPAIARCSARAQLLCLPTYLGDVDLAERATWTWWALTRACHVHPYELPPTAGEVEEWLMDVKTIAVYVK